MAVGISLSTKSDIAGYQTLSKSRVSSTEPCRCGILSCDACPIFATKDTRIAILNQRKLPPAAQHDLHEMMVRAAVRRALQAVEAHPTLAPEKWMQMQMKAVGGQRLQWQTSSQSESNGSEGVSETSEYSPRDEI